MQVKNIINQRQLVSTGTKNLISTDISTDTSNRKTYDNDILFEDLSDLVNSSFKCWYMKMFYSLGKDKVLKLAAIARADGKNKQRYFSYLLKNNNNE